MTKSTANHERNTPFGAHSWNVLRQVGRDVKGNLLATGLAVLAAVGVAAFQIWYVAAPAGPSRESALTAILRSLAVLLAYILFHLVRAPWQLYRQREGELQGRIKTIETEHQDTVRQLEGTLEQERRSRDAECLDYEREAHRLRELLGQPDLLLECVANPDQSFRKKSEYLLTLRNAGKPLVSNITAPETSVPMSDQIIRGGREMREAFPVEEAPSPSSATHWIIQFRPIKDLAGGDSTALSYVIRNIGALQRYSLVFVMSNCQHPGPNWREDFVVAVPLTIECESNGSRWRLKYDLCYSLLRKQMWVQSREFVKLL